MIATLVGRGVDDAVVFEEPDGLNFDVSADDFISNGKTMV